MKTLVAVGLAAALLVPVAASAQAWEPAENVSPDAHGDLAHAQDLSREAFEAVTAAQMADAFVLGGHAARAKELLRQASAEMKLAAEAADHR